LRHRLLRAERLSVSRLQITPEGRRLRARAAALTRHHPEDPEASAAERRTLKAAAAERYIRDLCGSMPALTVEERARLARLLLPGGERP
jgi:hypothetical protein